MCVFVLVGLLESLAGYSQQSETVLEAYLCPDLNYEQVSALFDIVPGLDTCHYDHTTGLYMDVCIQVYNQLCIHFL